MAICMRKWSGGRGLFLLTVLLSVTGLSLAVIEVAPASASGCGAAKPHGDGIGLAPPNGALPAGSAGAFQATVFKAAVIPQAGRRVTFKVVCGPNAGERATKTTVAHPDTGSGAPSAFFTDVDRKGSGTDLISATTTSPAGRTETASISIVWTPPVDCGRPLNKLGFVLALQCKVAKAKPMIETVLQLGQCAVGVATFLAPEAKLAALLRDADKAASVERLAKEAGTSTPVAKFVFDLARIQKKGILSFSQLKQTLEDAKSLPDFFHRVTNLFTAIPSGDVSQVALDVANLTGLGPCVDLLARIVKTSGGSSGAGGPTTPSPIGPGAGAGNGPGTGSGGTGSGGGGTGPSGGAFPDVAAGVFDSCAVVAGGRVECWGDNSAGELGTGSDTGPDCAGACSELPVAVSGISNAMQVAAGGQNACALLATGQVACWGYNHDGEVGDGTTTGPETCEGIACATTPASVVGITNAVQVAVGPLAACAVLATGAVDCWGAGPLGDGTTAGSAVPVAVAGITNATKVSAGGNNGSSGEMCARLASGGVDCWGNGFMGDGSSAPSDLPVAVSGLTTATDVATGYLGGCALLSSGQVECWGWNREGELGNGGTSTSTTPMPVSGVSSAVAIAAGGGYGLGGNACAVLKTGQIDCWGLNAGDQLGNGASTGPDECLDLFGNDDLSCSTTAVPVAGLTAALGVAVNGGHSCAVLAGGGVDCWGDNEAGDLGDGSTTRSDVPVPVTTG